MGHGGSVIKKIVFDNKKESICIYQFVLISIFLKFHNPQRIYESRISHIAGDELVTNFGEVKNVGNCCCHHF